MTPRKNKIKELQDRINALQNLHKDFANIINNLQTEINLLKSSSEENPKIENENEIVIENNSEQTTNDITTETASHLQSSQEETETEKVPSELPVDTTYEKPKSDESAPIIEQSPTPETEKLNTGIDSRFVKNSSKENDTKAERFANSYSYEEETGESKAAIHEKYRTDKTIKPNTSTHSAKENINNSLPKTDDLTKQTKIPIEAKDETAGIEKLINLVVRFFTEGNPIVRIGMVVLFFGLSFLTMYAASKGYFPIEFRLSVVGAISIGLIVLGWRTRADKDGYGLVLQGGGIAALYLTLYASAMIYRVIKPELTFGLMSAVVAFGVYLAVIQNTQTIALMATAGGFIAPIITSSGSNNYIGLFTFYLLLNIGILSIAWFKTWRLLNWVGFVFTFVIFGSWSLSKYVPANYATVQPFLIAFFALYLTVSILFSLKQPPKLTGIVDGSLLFGMPIATFGLQAKLLNHTEYGLAYSSLALSILYCCLTVTLWKKYKDTHWLLLQSFIALSVTFGTLTIPLAFNAKWTSAAWALEAVGLIWVGLKQQRLRSRIAGCFLYAAAIVSLIIDGISTGDELFITGDFFSIILLSISALCIGFVYMKHTVSEKAEDNQISYVFMVIGWLWWLAAGFLELQGHLDSQQLYWSCLIWLATSSVFISMLSKPLHWEQLNHFKYWLLPLVCFWVICHMPKFVLTINTYHPLQLMCLIAYAVVFVAQYWLLYQEKDSKRLSINNAYHIGAAWCVYFLIFWETLWLQNHLSLNSDQSILLWLASFSLPLVVLLIITKIPTWPFIQFESKYKTEIPFPLIVLLSIWFIVSCAFSGAQFYYFLPILNPIDLGMMAAILIIYWAHNRKFVNLDTFDKTSKIAILCVAIFVWINIALLRAMHVYQNIPYSTLELWNDPNVQMAISILWSLCALIIMKVSQARQSREIWKVGAILIGLIVLKLFAKDLDGQGTLARVISFMAVGGLLLLIGYLAPLPSKENKESDSSSTLPNSEK